MELVEGRFPYEENEDSDSDNQNFTAKHKQTRTIYTDSAIKIKPCYVSLVRLDISKARMRTTRPLSYAQIRREIESAEERDKRLKKSREYQRYRLAMETQEQREKRLSKLQNYSNKRRLEETNNSEQLLNRFDTTDIRRKRGRSIKRFKTIVEEREKRLKKSREYQRYRLSIETPEQREKRLSKLQENYYERKLKKTNNSEQLDRFDTTDNRPKRGRPKIHKKRGRPKILPNGDRPKIIESKEERQKRLDHLRRYAEFLREKQRPNETDAEHEQRIERVRRKRERRELREEKKKKKKEEMEYLESQEQSEQENDQCEAVTDEFDYIDLISSPENNQDCIEEEPIDIVDICMGQNESESDQFEIYEQSNSNVIEIVDSPTQNVSDSEEESKKGHDPPFVWLTPEEILEEEDEPINELTDCDDQMESNDNIIYVID